MACRPYRFRSLVAAESVEARAEVIGWADDLYEEQLQTWQTRKERHRRNKSRAPTLEECRAKSRQVRTKRERDHTYFNQTTAANPTR